MVGLKLVGFCKLTGSQIGVEYDLLKRHHSTNRRRRPPSPTYLDSVRSNGTGKYKKARRDPSNERSAPVDPQSLPQTNETTDEPAQDQPEGRKGKWSVNPKGTKPVKPTTLAFFPPLWVRLLDLAKARMQLYILVDDAFPPLATAIDGPCQECLLEAMAFNQESGNDELEDGYFPKYRREMARLVNLQYNDAPTFRCEIKKLVTHIIPIHYQLYPRSSARTDAERHQSIRDQANALLDNWLFLHGEPDERGKTSNFAHECLKRVCLSVFYSNTSKSLCQFPDFQTYVPYKALVLATAFVQVVLGVFSDHGCMPHQYKIDISKLKDSYDKLYRSLTRLAADEYHGEKLDKMLEDWATLGM
ncbi:hypothetical protein EV363DRAFT_1194276 [Boletus edulis]|nr:hypothetical protein EV363DRAFT_1194276 [Boletus edulis]